MNIVAGRVLGAKFLLEQPLARGGMGSVWVGRHLALETPVAIKLMDETLASSEAARIRFEREARAAARLRSPHVVQILDYGVDAGAPYIVLELLDGEDLRTRLQRVRRLSLRETSEIVSQLAKGLSLAHEAGIVHRDIKPSNVFIARIGPDEVVKLLDFGVAKHAAGRIAEDSTASGQVLGSPMYMSPEQARGAAVDHRSDQWSLAVVAFEALTGHRPFGGENAGDVVARICADELPVATDYAPDLPPEIDVLFSRALCRSPDGRFSDARELADELLRIAAASQPASERPLRASTPPASAARFREDATASQALPAATAAGASPVPGEAPPTMRPRVWSSWGPWAALVLCAGGAWLVWRGAERGQTAASVVASPNTPTAEATSSAASPPEVVPVRSAEVPAPEPAPATSSLPRVPAQRAATSGRRPPRPAPASDSAARPSSVDSRFGLPLGAEGRP